MTIQPCLKHCLIGSMEGIINLVPTMAANPGTQERCRTSALSFYFHHEPFLNCAHLSFYELKAGFVMQRANDMQTKTSRPAVVDDGYDEEEHSETLCGTCGGRYNANEFWIGCDICERWFHGKCVRITPAKAEHIKHYKCPDCSSSKKSRQ